jgi:cytochrome c oxidase assembly protein subunit 15
LLQVILGTQVREQIDTIAKSLEYRWRELWVEQVSSVFLVHRTASWIVLAVNALLFWQIFKQKKLVSVNLRRSALLIVGLIVCEIGLGVTLAYYSMPKAAQPAHLLLASGLFATQLWCALEIFSSTTNSSPTT